MRKITYIFMALTMQAGLSANEIKKDLPAGGSFHYVTKWDRIDIKCTSNPVVPVVLAHLCGCLKDYRNSAGGFRFYLRLKNVLSTGEVTQTDIADAETAEACEDKRKGDYKELCEFKVHPAQ